MEQLTILYTSVLVLSFVIIPSKSEIECSSDKRCECFKEGGMLIADCRGKGITVFPNLTGNVEILLLGKNAISEFPRNVYEIPRKLTYLDVSFNKFVELHDNFFQFLTNLKSLFLNGNSIDYRNISDDCFKGLKNLEVLNLKSQDVLMKDAFQYPTAIAHCDSLQVLELDGYNRWHFDVSFKNMTSLTNISLSGNENKRCNINYLEAGYFQNTPYLIHIDISFCRLKIIELGTFDYLNQLRYLNFSHNEQLTFRVLRNVTTDLQFTKIDTLDASKIHCTFGVGTYLRTDDILGMQNTSLKVLHLDQNRINSFEPGLFSKLPTTLYSISVKDNKFTMGGYVLELKAFKSVKFFDGSYQSLSHNPLSIENHFQFDCRDYRGPETHRLMERERHTENSMDCGTTPVLPLNAGYDILPVPPLLETIKFRQSTLTFSIPKAFFDNNNVKHMDFSNNILHTWIGPLMNLKKLQSVDLSNNYCSRVSSQFFMDAGSLLELNVSNNLLGFALTNDTIGEIFRPLNVLKNLDVSFNRIEILPPKIFTALVLLEYLNLSSNLISDWTFEISHMTKLKLINISNNQLITIPEVVRSHIDDVKDRTNLTIDLSNNKFQCSCTTLSFIKWMESNDKLFHDFQKYQCRTTDGAVIEFENLFQIIADLERNCESYVGMILGSVVAMVFCLFTVLAGLVYRYRWKVRYLYFLAKNKYKGHLNIRDKANKCYHYDAFISYADEDRDFVLNDVVQNLETDKEFELCLHQRDFLAGMAIAENITNAIHNSKKTVVIFSKNYLKSRWCMFEFNMARMESIYSRDGENVLFVVMYENVRVCKLPMMVLDVIESQSYVEYPSDQQGNVVFWDKIAEAIRS